MLGTSSFCVGIIFLVCVVDFGVSVFMLVIITLEGEGFSLGPGLCHCFDWRYKYEKLFKCFLLTTWRVPVSKWALRRTSPCLWLALGSPPQTACEFSSSAAGIRPTTLSDPWIGLTDKYQLQDVTGGKKCVALWNRDDSQFWVVSFQQAVKSIYQSINLYLQNAES